MAAQTQTSLVVLLLKLLQMRSLFAFFSGFLLLIFQLLIMSFFHSDLQRDRTEAKHLMCLARNPSGVLTSLKVPGIPGVVWLSLFGCGCNRVL